MFNYQLTAFPSRYPLSGAFQTPWGLKGNQVVILISSCKAHSRPLYRDIPSTSLNSVALLKHRVGDSIAIFFYPLI